MHRRKDLKKLLNLGLLDYTNMTPKIGELDMPYVHCGLPVKVDYLATYSQPSTYFMTGHTCVSFFEYDVHFDGLYGLWNAIYYGVEELQEYYKERFQGIQYFIAPDYSKCGDAPEEENRYRQFRSRIVSIWLAMKLNAVVIPLVSCANQLSIDYMLDGMDDCTTVAFSSKGPMGDPTQMAFFKAAIKATVDRLHQLNTIIVYSTSPNRQKVFDIFRYAIEAGIDVQIPDNMLMIRHRLIGGDAQ